MDIPTVDRRMTMTPVHHRTPAQADMSRLARDILRSLGSKKKLSPSKRSKNFLTGVPADHSTSLTPKPQRPIPSPTQNTPSRSMEHAQTISDDDDSIMLLYPEEDELEPVTPEPPPPPSRLPKSKQKSDLRVVTGKCDKCKADGSACDYGSSDSKCRQCRHNRRKCFFDGITRRGVRCNNPYEQVSRGSWASVDLGMIDWDAELARAEERLQKWSETAAFIQRTVIDPPRDHLAGPDRWYSDAGECLVPGIS